ncbi:MAG: hypothetical protein KDE27_04280 [Planctomycetes bacterium]|nr:hypothetical protein [Planctomycetota bacterium]
MTARYRSVFPFAAALLAAAGIAQNAPQPPMGAPLSGLTAAEAARFEDGGADFRHVFQIAEGLGPIFNQNACSTCHNNPIGGPGSIKVTRFGSYNPKGGGWNPLANLGGSLLQANTIDVQCSEIVPAAANVQAQRVTTSTLGIGLIEAIPDADLLYWVANPPSPNVSGRAHMTVPPETPNGPPRVGRFGWKAQLATVLGFAGDAAVMEIGITNRLFATENAPNGNVAALALCDNVPDPEDGPDPYGRHFIDRVTNFQRYLAPPPQTPRSGTGGEALFAAVGCTDCHIASFTTDSDPALEVVLRGVAIRPYSDFLLHDMGLNADFIGQGQAEVQEMRTPPLWGVRNRDPLWHDGRVAGGTLASRLLGTGGVIDLHAGFGSEAMASATLFQALSASDQMLVVAFLDSLGKREFDGNGDGRVDRLDWAMFVSARGPGVTPDDPRAVFDFDRDGDVDVDDYDVMGLVYEEDCNGNGVSDLLDLQTGYSQDANYNALPDECEYCQTDLGFGGGGTLALSVCGDDLTQPGSRASVVVKGAAPLAQVFLVASLAQSQTPWPIVPNELVVPALPAVLAAHIGDASPAGEFHFVVAAFGGSQSLTWICQAAGLDGTDLDMSNAVAVQIAF